MAVNKVVLGNQTIMDITDTTATANKVVSGYTAYGANGVKMTGTLDLSGFMTKSTYDTDDDGVVDLAENAQNLGGNPPSYYAPASAIPTIDSALDTLSTNPVQNAVITSTLNQMMDTAYQDFSQVGHTHDNATSLADGFMAKEDKAAHDTLVQRVNQDLKTTATPSFAGLNLNNGYIDGALFR